MLGQRRESQLGQPEGISSNKTINVARSDLWRTQNEMMLNLAKLFRSQTGLQEKRRTITPRKRRIMAMHRKLFFFWKSNWFEFQAKPNKLSPAPTEFTKI